jgi:broad specificity phosphatase PhoE
MAAVGRVLGHEADRLRGAKLSMDKVLGNTEEPIYIMRHGRTALDALKRSDGWLDFPLTDDGRRGIIPTQQYLKDIPKPLCCIYAPSLKRTQETAEIIQSGMGVEPADIVASDAARTWNLGKKLLGGKKYPNRPVVKHYMNHPNEVPEDGESLNQFKKRFLTWFNDLRDEKRAGPILLVLSGSNIREISELLTKDRETLDLDEGGLLELHCKKGRWFGTVILGSKHESKEEPSMWGS